MNNPQDSSETRPNWDDDFSVMILRFFDDDLTAEEFEKFNELLKCHPHLRTQYVEFAIQEMRLEKALEQRPQHH